MASIKLRFILHKDSCFVSRHIRLHGGECGWGVIQTSFAKPSVFVITVLKVNTRVGHEVKTALGTSLNYLGPTTVYGKCT